MTVFLLRDDDANATTDPSRLARTYAPLLDAGLTMNLSVIPEVALDTRAPDGVRERFLSESWSDEDKLVTLRADAPIACWLRANRSQLEPMVHGLTHQRVRGETEFGSLSEREADLRMERGKMLLEAAMSASVAGFVAPWDALSSGAIRAATRRFRVLSTSWLDRSRLPMRWWGAHYLERVRRSETLRLGDAWVLRHRGGPVGAALDPAAVSSVVDRLAHRAELCVIVLHHWMFWDRSEPHPVLRALARALAGRTVLRVSDAVSALDGGLWRAA